MSEAPFGEEETGFAFTDEDYARRYSGEKSTAGPTPAAPASQPARPGRLHGGGNSFMRARRRRLAAAAST
jgi:hypothetical protein